mmetsp:Transcript_7649/g.10856  ORF Transcript_7649/g.10856 Transcript_7649/m.10856 type:complete len:263 (+) Transcript_7649:311-1099(+)
MGGGPHTKTKGSSSGPGQYFFILSASTNPFSPFHSSEGLVRVCMTLKFSFSSSSIRSSSFNRMSCSLVLPKIRVISVFSSDLHTVLMAWNIGVRPVPPANMMTFDFLKGNCSFTFFSGLCLNSILSPDFTSFSFCVNLPSGYIFIRSSKEPFLSFVETGVYGRSRSSPGNLARIHPQIGRLRLFPSGSPISKSFESWLCCRTFFTVSSVHSFGRKQGGLFVRAFSRQSPPVFSLSLPPFKTFEAFCCIAFPVSLAFFSISFQ